MATKIDSKKEELKGVGGWLWWSALVLMVISPMIILVQMSEDFSNSGVFINLINISIVIASVAAGIMIFTQAKKAIIFTKGFYISYLILAIVDFGFYLYYSSMLPSYLLQDLDYTGTFRNLLAGIFWLSYFTLSTRVKNTFKETKIGLKFITTIVVVSLFIFIGGLSIETNLSQGGVGSIEETNRMINDSLLGGYVVYYPFTNLEKSEIKVEFTSTLPIIVHFVLSEQDYENFMKDLNYESYEGCSFYNQMNKQIVCNVSTGGIVVYNPNTVSTEYTIQTLS